MMVLDITDVSSMAKLIEEKGPFDILVNSAGLGRHTPSIDTPVEDFDEVMSVNLRGAYFVTQAVAKGLIKSKKPGSLVNISCLLYTSPSPRDGLLSRMPSSA